MARRDGGGRFFRKVVATLLALGGFGFGLTYCAYAADARARPNIVIILADDLGYSDLGCYGSEIETPQLDRLASQGLRFTQFYNTGRCWPSRAALLTGYYAQQVNRDPSGPRPAWAALLPELLRSAGYHSYHAGKWHVDGPVLAGGFERSYHIAEQDRYFTPTKHELDDQRLAQPKPDDGYYASTAVADRAVEWLAFHDAQHKQAPFFLYVAFTAPHFPLQAPAEDIARYRDRYLAGWEAVRRQRSKRQAEMGIYRGDVSAPESSVIPAWNMSEQQLQKEIGPEEVGYAVAWDSLTPEQRRFQAAKMAVHAAMIDRMDREIGRVMDKIRAMGLADDTIVCFASDNGASAEQIIRGDRHTLGAEPGSAASYLGLGPGWSTVANTPLRRHKSWNHEGGIATPLVVCWPAGIRARSELRHLPSHLIDIVPTLLELTGATAPSIWNDEPRPPLPGISLVPAFSADVHVDRELFFKHTVNRALRWGDWKITAAGKDAPWELYNLAVDRIESHDLASQDPEMVAKLAARWSQRDAEYAAQGATAKELPGKSKRRKAK